MTKITSVFSLAKLANTDVNLFVCDYPEPRECTGKCKKLFIPTNADISTRRPSVYWKQCATCRTYMQERNAKCTEKKQKLIKYI